VLSKEVFSGAVKDALRNFVYSTRLAGNPLLRSRLVLEDQGFTLGEGERIKRLAEVILQVIKQLKTGSRTERYYQALDLTYLHPVATQEEAAESLDLPFSTYRRYLKSGIDLVTELLWQREIGAGEIEQKMNSF
jgi:hypothetical protein